MDKIHNASLKIAGALGHAWARYADPGPDGFIRFRSEEAKKASAEDRFGGNYVPENCGTSGTGRIRWSVFPRKDGAAVWIRICRPGAVAGTLDYITVIECEFIVGPQGEWLWGQEYSLQGCTYAEERHWAALDSVLEAFDLQVDSLSDDYSRPVLVQR